MCQKLCCNVMQYYLPVSIDSLTIQLPLRSTASQCIMQPWVGISITSPGTNNSVEITSVIRLDFGSSLLTSVPRTTVTTSELCTVLFKFFWF